MAYKKIVDNSGIQVVDNSGREVLSIIEIILRYIKIVRVKIANYISQRVRINDN